MLSVWLVIALKCAPLTVQEIPQGDTMKTFDLVADSSVWVYSHASDPTHDPFLRVWGAGGLAISGSGPSDDWSYGYLGWKLQNLPKGIPKSAVLILHNVSPSSLKPDSEPLQARALNGKFGDDWDYSKANDVVPGPEDTVFGEAKATDLLVKPIEIRIRLDKNNFLAYLAKSREKNGLFLALTSKSDPNVDGASSDKGGVYKIFSAAAAKEDRPVLHLEY